MLYLGDMAKNQTVRFMWSTNDANGASVTCDSSNKVFVYKDNNSGTEVDTGVANDNDFDGLTGVHSCVITTTDAFYEAGHDYTVVLKTATIDGQAVNAVLAHFSIENRVVAAVSGDAIYTATSGTANDGTETLTYAATAINDGTRWQITNDHGQGDSGIDVEVTFNLGSNHLATQLNINGYYDRAAGSGVVEIYVWNYTTEAFEKLSIGTSDTEMRKSNNDHDYIFSLTTANTKPTATMGEVKIRFLATNDNDGDILNLDYIGVTGSSTGVMSPQAVAHAVWSSDDGHAVSRHIPMYTGHVWYVDNVNGDDGNAGNTVHEPVATIAQAISLASVGDRIVVKSGTYNEAVNLSLTGLELHGEYGAIVTGNGSANCITISANDCAVYNIFATPAATYYGFITTGVHRCLFERCDSYGGGAGGFYIHEDAGRVKFDRCFARGYTGTGFTLKGPAAHLEDCVAMSSSGSTKGFSMAHDNAHRCVLHNCHSVNNTAASYEIVSGADNNMIHGCSASAGCGAVVDNGTDTSWRDFSIAEVPEVNVTKINGDATNGNNASLKLKQLSIQNDSGTALIAKATDGNNHGVEIAASGSGHGIITTGGNDSGHGLYACGGSEYGAGIKGYGGAQGHGMELAGQTDGSGVYIIGGSDDGYGIYVESRGSTQALPGIYVKGASYDVDADIHGTIDTTTDVTNSVTLATAQADQLSNCNDLLNADKVIVTDTTPWRLEHRDKNTKSVLLSQDLKNTAGADITSKSNVLGSLTLTTE